MHRMGTIVPANPTFSEVFGGRLAGRSPGLMLVYQPYHLAAQLTPL
jgi:hypothetical protein